jgi:16S rRNA (guanine966-N2)-methyltransferase
MPSSSCSRADLVRTRGLRVIAGSARGRRLSVPAGDDVRPTKDRVREAMFSALDARDAIVDANVLDLYAGTGALAIEALSRGAARAVLVERSHVAAATTRLNVDTTGFASVARVETRDVSTFLAALPIEAPFGLVLCDPPYDVSDEQLEAVLARLATPEWLTPDAIVVVERAHRANVTAPTGLRVSWERRFGDTLVWFFQP